MLWSSQKTVYLNALLYYIVITRRWLLTQYFKTLLQTVMSYTHGTQGNFNF